MCGRRLFSTQKNFLNRVHILDYSDFRYENRWLRYSTGLAMQDRLLARMKNQLPQSASIFNHYILLLQHSPTYTAGRRMSDTPGADVRRPVNGAVADYERVMRGGELTFHGPGQLVAYFLLDLNFLKVHSRMCYIFK